MTDPAKTLFETGVAFLTSRGVKEKHARSMLGKWRKNHGDAEALKALHGAIKADASEPLAFIEGSLKGGSSPIMEAIARRRRARLSG